MADYDGVKPNRTISHNLEDRLGATLDERLAAQERANAERGEAPSEAHPTEPVGNTSEPVAPDEGTGKPALTR
jgi:hypothetical protein